MRRGAEIDSISHPCELLGAFDAAAQKAQQPLSHRRRYRFDGGVRPPVRPCQRASASVEAHLITCRRPPHTRVRRRLRRITRTKCTCDNARWAPPTAARPAKRRPHLSNRSCCCSPQRSSPSDRPRPLALALSPLRRNEKPSARALSGMPSWQNETKPNRLFLVPTRARVFLALNPLSVFLYRVQTF